MPVSDAHERHAPFLKLDRHQIPRWVRLQPIQQTEQVSSETSNEAKARVNVAPRDAEGVESWAATINLVNVI